MSLREKINQSPAWSVGIFTVCVTSALLGAWYTISPSSNALPTKAFFTVDDGQTLFSDDADRQTPFQRGGKEAVKAYVYSCDGGKTQFVAYLEKMPPGAAPAAGAAPEAAARTETGRQMAPSRSAPPAVRPGAFSSLIKKPGAGQWLKPGDPSYFPTISPKCPDGSGKFDRVFP